MSKKSSFRCRCLRLERIDLANMLKNSKLDELIKFLADTPFTRYDAAG